MSQGVAPKLGLVLGLVLLLLVYKTAADGAGLEALRETVSQAGPWAPAVYVALRASTYIIAPLSLPWLDLTGGIFFGVWQAIALSIVGQTLGGSVNFWIARVLGRPAVERVAGARITERIDAIYERVRGWKGLLILRLVFPGYYDFLSYGAGLTPLRFRHYFWVSVLGGLPGVSVSVALGPVLLESPLLFFALSFGYGAVAVALILIYQRVTGDYVWGFDFLKPAPARAGPEERPSP